MPDLVGMVCQELQQGRDFHRSGLQPARQTAIMDDLPVPDVNAVVRDEPSRRYQVITDAQRGRRAVRRWRQRFIPTSVQHMRAHKLLRLPRENVLFVGPSPSLRPRPRSTPIGGFLISAGATAQSSQKPAIFETDKPTASRLSFDKGRNAYPVDSASPTCCVAGHGGCSDHGPTRLPAHLG